MDSTLLQPVTAVEKDTLVIYILNEDDPIFKENFDFFLLAGVQEGSRCYQAPASNTDSQQVLAQLRAFHGIRSIFRSDQAFTDCTCVSAVG
jgi:hypothetical protein